MPNLVLDPRFIEEIGGIENIENINIAEIIENSIFIPVYGEKNSERLPSYHRLDIRVSKIFRFNSWKLGIFLELLNTYNRKNILDYRYTSQDYSTKEPINQLPIIPYLGFTAEF